MSNLCSFSI